MHTKNNAAFAVVKVPASHELERPREVEARLRSIAGVRNVLVDRARRTIHVLYDGHSETLHRLGILVCETGDDVATFVRAVPLGNG